MKKYLILFSTFFLFFFSISPSEAFFLNKIDRTIKKAKIENKSTISISVKNFKTGKTIYRKKSKKLLHPASSLKLFTFAPSYEVLGKNYEFKTQIFKDNKNNLYIKLGADPLLATKDLKNLVSLAKKNYTFKTINKIYIDDTIIDKKPYPTGWSSDDISLDMPKISPYTLNQNQVSLQITINHKGIVEIFQEDAYKISFINELVKDDFDKILLSKSYGDDNDIITINGTVSKPQLLTIPVNNPKFYFIANLEEIFKSQKIPYNKMFYFQETPKNAKEISCVSHNIADIAKSILQKSDNFSSEVLFKVAGGKYAKKPYGSTADGILMFENYYKNLGLSLSDIKITDASGVSRYNLLTADWMSEVLLYLGKNTDIKSYMAVPDVGTLNKRLRHLRGKLWAKTGTLSGVSSLVGFVTMRDKKEAVFAIIIQNFNKKSSVIKAFEDDLIDAIFKY